MQNYITNFKYHYELFPIKEINESNIIFANKDLPFEFYIPSFQKAFLDIEKNPTLQVNYEDLIYNGQPSDNIFDFLELVNKEQLYIEFANLLFPKNKKEKLNKLKNIKDFVSTYGYIYKIELQEYDTEEIFKPLSEIETEIKKFNTILAMQKILDLTKKEEIKVIEPIKFLNTILKDNDELLVYASLYDFKDEIKISDDRELGNILNLFKHCICVLTNKVINNCKINYSYSIDSEPQYEFVCNSLLELMYLQFVTDVSNANNEYGTCEYCGKYVLINNHNKNKKHIYCPINKEDKSLTCKDRSPCASNAAMERYRAKNKI